jgi:hypothetical protein
MADTPKCNLSRYGRRDGREGSQRKSTIHF